MNIPLGGFTKSSHFLTTPGCICEVKCRWELAVCVLKPAQGEMQVSWWESPRSRPLDLCLHSLCLNLELWHVCFPLSFSNQPIFLVPADFLSSSLQNLGLRFFVCLFVLGGRGKGIS